MGPETRYAKSGDVHIAYQVIGDGPLDLVFVPGFVSHLELAWEEAALVRFYQRLASFSRLILFDKRGTGLSDRVTEVATLEQRMDDVRAVMDAVSSERAALFGVSEGGPMSLLFAASYPERVSALVLYGSGSRFVWAPDYAWAGMPEQWQRMFDEVAEKWGAPHMIENWAPSRVDDARFRQWLASYQRAGASPGAVIDLWKMNMAIDARHILPAVRVPALIVHRTGDRAIKVEHSRYMAAHIPGAKYVELPGEDHLWWLGDADTLLDRVDEFLTGARHAVEPDRVLATVLFTDMVARPSAPLSWETVAGETSWKHTTLRCGESSPASAAERSTEPATASWPPSTARLGRFAAPAPSATPSVSSTSRSGPGCTPASAR